MDDYYFHCGNPFEYFIIALQFQGGKRSLYNCMSADCTNCPRIYPASADGFSKYSRISVRMNATARQSPSGLKSGFSGHPCPEIAGLEAEY